MILNEEDIYNSIESFRNSRGLSQSKMADIMGLSNKQAYSNMIKKRTMKMVYFINLLNQYNLDPTFFLYQKNIHTHDSSNKSESKESDNNQYTAPKSPEKRCDNPYCLKRISELENDKRLLTEYNDLLKAQLARGGLNEGKSPAGGLEESPTG